MTRDQIFNDDTDYSSDFEFNEQVAAVFGDMLNRSVPFYSEQQNMINEIAKRFWVPDTRVVDLGSSLGTTLINIAAQNPEINSLSGYDNSDAMLARARDNIDKAGLSHRVTLSNVDLNGDLDNLDLRNTSLATLCWTLQFIRPLKRDQLIKKIYDNMVNGGALIVTDKVLTNDSNMNRFFIDFYYDYKRKNGYSEEEIINKREALENVLIPYRSDENFELFRRNGFEIVETFFQWYNFAGFLCVKNTG